MPEAEADRPAPARYRWARWLLFAGWAALVLYLGSQPPGDLPRMPWIDLPGIDKLEHAGMYGVLGFLGSWATGPRSPWKALLGGLAVGLAWGGLDEWIQSAVPGRFSDAGDWAADALGSAAGAWLAWRSARRQPAFFKLDSKR